MKKTVLFITFLTILNIANGQLNHPIDSLIYSDVRYFMIIDSLKVEGLRNNIDKSCIFVNGRPIDSTKISCDGIPVWYKNNLFFNTESKNLSKKIMYSPHDGVKKYSSVFSVDNGFAQYYSYDYTNIYVVNPLSGDRKLYTNYDKIPDCVVSGFFIDAARACVIHCCDGVEACDYIRCYLTSSAETKEITQQILQTFNEKDAVLTDLNFNFITNDGKYLHLGVQYMSDQHNVKRKTFSRIFDLKFNFIGNALNIQDSYINGVNIQNNHIQNYFLSSWTDTKDSIKIKKRAIYPYKNVIVPYRFNPVLELA
ncbi:MAG: hypothetical protein LBH32_09010, partial [Dysgonamonadaceae bacterium]|nr:hypothetical protein [Dysgonamonadaceae bacterium]